MFSRQQIYLGGLAGVRNTDASLQHPALPLLCHRKQRGWKNCLGTTCTILRVISSFTLQRQIIYFREQNSLWIFLQIPWFITKIKSFNAISYMFKYLVNWIFMCFRDSLKILNGIALEVKTETLYKLNNFQNPILFSWQMCDNLCLVFKLELKVFYLNLFVENKLTQKNPFTPFLDNPL